MTLQHKNLISLPAHTKNGIRLGYVVSFEIDELDQRIKYYNIKTHVGLAGLFDKQLIVSSQQVVSLSREKLVVEDTVLKQPNSAPVELQIKSPQSAQ